MFETIISVENLLESWREFLCGKRKRRDVQEFSARLTDNIFSLHRDLATLTYRHGLYQAFRINDPKPREIHKATVRDRLVHRAIYRILYPRLDRKLIADSYSCRLGKGAHRAINRFRSFGYKVSQNNTRTCRVLKCDIRRFFANINHDILYSVLGRHIFDVEVLWLIRRIVGSFYSTAPGVGLPLGNLTSQLFVNIYMNELDRYVKYALKVRYYIRYADDFVVLSHDEQFLRQVLEAMGLFLCDRLRLTLHSDKVFIRTLASGVDFLGWVHFPDHRVPRSVTRRRIMRRIAGDIPSATVQSYLGLLKHGNAYGLRRVVAPE